MIPETEPVNNYYGNNEATQFDFNFYIEDETQLTVTHTDLDGVETTLEFEVDYTINEVGNENGSYITFPIQGSSYDVLAWDEDTDEKEILSLALDLPFTQEAEYTMSSTLNKETLEYSFDKLTRICQILRRQLERCVKVSEGSSGTADEILSTLTESLSQAIAAAESAQTNAASVEESYSAIQEIVGSEEQINELLEILENAENLSNTSLTNLTQSGLDKLNYRTFSINTGDIDESGNPTFIQIDNPLVIDTAYSSDGISNFNVNTETYFDDVTSYGDYLFTYDGTTWTLVCPDDTTVQGADLSNYGITFTELYSASYHSTSDTIESVTLDETQFLTAVESSPDDYTFLCNVIEGNADTRIESEFTSETIDAVEVDNSIYFDNIDEAVYTFKYKYDTVTYEDEDGNLAENNITYTDDDGSETVGSMYYTDEDDQAVITNITYEDEDGNSYGAWYLNNEEVTLSDYGITVEGTPEEGDEIEITVNELVEDTIYWTLSGSQVELSDYGITIEGTPSSADIILVTVSRLLTDGDTITITVHSPEDDTVEQTYQLITSGEWTATTADGSSYTVSEEITCDIQDLDYGVYNVYVDPVNLEMTCIDNDITAGVVMTSGDDDFLLNISQIPYDLQSQTETGLTWVRAGILTVSDLGKFLTLFRYNTNNLYGATNTVNQIGDPITTLNAVLADNEIWLEGAEISCTSYPALYEVYGDTYGTASTDGYFVLPDFRGRVIQGADSFGYIDAGLPDLYGYIGIPSKTSDGSLFYGTRSGDLYDHSSGGGTCQYGKMYFKASNYDAIYGNSDTVQPPAIRVRIKTRFI